MRKLSAWQQVPILLLVGAIVGGAARPSIERLIPGAGVTNMQSENAVKVLEPLLISGDDPEQRNHYLLPAGTVLYSQHNFAEGHTMYAVYFNFKGYFASEPSDPKTINPLWLFNVEQEDVSSMLKNYPLTKEELVRILKARKATRDDLLQIARDWVD